MAINFFIAPLNLSAGSLVGIAQIVSYVTTGGFNLTGLVSFLVNIPFLILAYRSISKTFFLKTIVATFIQSTLMSLLPVMTTPILPDVLSNCLFGAVIAGASVGLCLRAGGSGGGLDILGIYFASKKPGFSVGKVSYMINTVVLAIFALLFDLPTAMYSLLFIVIAYFVADKIHVQNRDVYALIITKNKGLRQALIEKTRRGVTYWNGFGGYTNSDKEVLLTVFNRYETRLIRQVIKEEDPEAFMILTQGQPLLGYFEKRLV